jgi:hypothetical protein
MRYERKERDWLAVIGREMESTLKGDVSCHSVDTPIQDKQLLRSLRTMAYRLHSSVIDVLSSSLVSLEVRSGSEPPSVMCAADIQKFLCLKFLLSCQL